MKKLKKSSLRKIQARNRETSPIFISPAFLLPEEKIIFKTNPHWLFVVVPEIGLLMIAILLFTYLSFLWPEVIFLPTWVWILYGASFAFTMIVVFLHWININYYLTNFRLVEERGIIGKRIMSIWLNKVQDVTVKFGILGRIFGFGDIEIESAGTYGKIVFNFLPSPRKLGEEIEKAVSDFHQHSRV